MGFRDAFFQPQAHVELSDVLVRISSDLSSGNLDSARVLFEQHLLQICLGIGRGSVRSILYQFIDSGADTSGVAHAFLPFFSAETTAFPHKSNARFPAHLAGISQSRFLAFREMFELRLRGDIHGAMNQVHALRPSPKDKTHSLAERAGWELFIAVQSGTTAMLAGQLKQALGYFMAAKMHAIMPSFPFLVREAYVKSALIHATFGDSEEARRLLAKAEQIPLSESWVEELTDAAVGIVQALVEFEDAERSKDTVDAIALQSVGELWPYYLIALQRSYERAGHRESFKLKLQVFETLPLPYLPGNGFSGCVIATVQASLLLVTGDFRTAKSLLDGLDQDFVGVQIMQGYCLLASGKPTNAIAAVSDLSPEATGLRQVELWRLAILASSHMRLEAIDNVLEILGHVLNLPGGVRVVETQHFSPEVRALAIEQLPDWTGKATVASNYIDAVMLQRESFTDRELEILSLLGQNKSRAVMAAELYISVNTLKTHLTTIYKKLNANSKLEALHEMVTRGMM